jgi:hypothetical protein
MDHVRPSRRELLGGFAAAALAARLPALETNRPTPGERCLLPYWALDQNI